MTTEKAKHVAEMTLRVVDYPGLMHAIRFGNRHASHPYYCGPKGKSLDVALTALRGQLSVILEDWELIQGGKNGNAGNPT